MSGFGHTASQGWARITGAGRHQLREMRQQHETGPVRTTIVFTDIVGSTQLGSKLPIQRLASFNEEHEGLVSRLAAEEAGNPVESTGDDFLLTFPDPDSALRFAKRLTSSLASGGIGVRVGIHVGDVILTGGRAHGIDISAAYRVMEANKGVGVLLSPAPRDLLRRPDQLVNKGEFTLQDLAPWFLYGPE